MVSYTDHSLVQVRYLSIAADTFNGNNLKVSIQVNGKEVTWSPVTASQENAKDNLLGTLRVIKLTVCVCVLLLCCGAYSTYLPNM